MRQLVVVTIVCGMRPGQAAADSEMATSPLKPFEAAVRVGFQSTTITADDDAPAGGGLVAELEAGVRVTRWLSLDVFGAYSSIDDTIRNPFPGEMPATSDEHVRFLDLGVRASLHIGGAFGGVGLGVDHFRQSDATGEWGDNYRMGELHVGYAFPAFHGVAPQLAAMLTKTFADNASTYDIGSVRVVVGAGF